MVHKDLKQKGTFSPNTPPAPAFLKALFWVFCILTRGQKWQWIIIGLWASFLAFAEMVTGACVVFFAQILNKPEETLAHVQKICPKDFLMSFPFENPSQLLRYCALGVMLIYSLKNGISLWQALYQSRVIAKTTEHIKSTLMGRFFSLGYKSYLSSKTEDLLQLIAVDVEQMCTHGLTAVAIILSEGVVAFSLLLSLLIFQPQLTFVLALGAGLLSLLMAKLLLPRFYALGFSARQAAKSLDHAILYGHQGFKDIRLRGGEAKILQYFGKNAWQRAKSQAAQYNLSQAMRLSLENFFVVAFAASVIFLSLKSVRYAHIMGVLSGYLYVGFRLMPGINRILSQINLFKATIPSIQKVYEQWHSPVIPWAHTQDPSDKVFSFERQLVLENVGLQYKEGGPWILRGADLRIKKGEWIGIVGKTGSGKSSLLDILLGLLEPTEGLAYLDDGQALHHGRWYPHIAYVPQHVVVMPGSLRENMGWSEKEASLKKRGEGDLSAQEAFLRNVIEKVCLGELVDKLPQGLESWIGEGHHRLSGGEQQRLALARAFFKPEASLLVLDEATSALDEDTQEKIMDGLKENFKDKTVIIVAHRLSTLTCCHRIIEVKDGRILEKESL